MIEKKKKGRKYVTSDTGGRLRCYENKASPLNNTLQKGDYLFVCGDFGYVWNNSSFFEKVYLETIRRKPFLTCFVDGNHENFDALNSYPVELWNEGKVHVIGRDDEGSPNIVHLMRGEYYNIDGDKIFAFGGAHSIDRLYRIPGISWWKGEMPSEEEMSNGIKNLEAHDWKCDYVLTHALPKGLMKKEYRHNEQGEEVLNNYLEEIRRKLTYKHWYSGHLHISQELSDKHTVLFKNIREMNGNLEIAKKIDDYL